jgi:hypothetical protein
MFDRSKAKVPMVCSVTGVVPLRVDVRYTLSNTKVAINHDLRVAAARRLIARLQSRTRIRGSPVS